MCGFRHCHCLGTAVVADLWLAEQSIGFGKLMAWYQQHTAAHFACSNREPNPAPSKSEKAGRRRAAACLDSVQEDPSRCARSSFGCRLCTFDQGRSARRLSGWTSQRLFESSSHGHDQRTEVLPPEGTSGAQRNSTSLLRRKGRR